MEGKTKKMLLTALQCIELQLPQNKTHALPFKNLDTYCMGEFILRSYGSFVLVYTFLYKSINKLPFDRFYIM